MLIAFRFKTIVSITEGSSSLGTARLTKRFKASPPESEMRSGSERRFVSSGARGNGKPLSPNGSLSIPRESMNAGGATPSTRPRFSPMKEFGVGAGGRDSLGCLPHSR